MELQKKLLMRNQYRKENFLLEEFAYNDPIAIILGLVVLLIFLGLFTFMQSVALLKERKKNVELALQCAMLKTKLDKTKNIFESSGR